MFFLSREGELGQADTWRGVQNGRRVSVVIGQVHRAGEAGAANSRSSPSGISVGCSATEIPTYIFLTEQSTFSPVASYSLTPVHRSESPLDQVWCKPSTTLRTTVVLCISPEISAGGILFQTAGRL